MTFSHFGLTCDDPVLLEKFYTKYFNFKRTRVYAPGPDQVVMIKSGNIALELFKSTESSPLSPPVESGYNFKGWRHMCFQVEDLDAKLKEMGEDAKITLGPLNMDEFIAGMKVCWIADPEGNIVELNQGYKDENNPPPLEE